MKDILFGIQRVLTGALVAYLLGPTMLLLVGNGPLSSRLLALGLILALVDGIISLRGYRSRS